MTKNKILEATTSIVQVLEPLKSEERMRVVQAALTMLGEDAVRQPNINDPDNDGDGDTDTRRRKSVTAKTYFDAKNPKSKIEELAVGARYREEKLGAETSTKAQLMSVIKDARRNFDASKYNRDLENARGKGIFTRGTGKDSAVLSHRGQNFVDALPNRDAANKIVKGQRKKRRKSKKKAVKKAANKK